MRNFVWMLLFVLTFGFVVSWVVVEPVLALRQALTPAAVSEAGGTNPLGHAPARMIHASQ
jgi:hypothetical protein